MPSEREKEERRMREGEKRRGIKIDGE